MGTKRTKLPANPKSDSNNTNLTEQKKPGRNRLKSGSVMAKTSSDHFLEMKTLLESMQDKFQKELKSLQEQVTYQASKMSSLVPPMAHQGLCQMIPNTTINHIMPTPLNPPRTVPWGYTPQSFHLICNPLILVLEVNPNGNCHILGRWYRKEPKAMQYLSLH